MGEAKKKKHRDCPAKGGIITPEDCGRGRNRAIACPVTCPHNPFALANYREHFLPLEGKVIEQLGRKLIAELSPAQVREMADAMDRRDEFVTHALHTWHLLGEGRLAKWQSDGFTRGWKNDEEVMLGHFATLRPALFEFREVLDALTCTAVDLLRPELPPFVVIDSGAAALVGRYEVVLGWRYELPAGQRLSGGAITLPAIPGMDPRAAFDVLLAHLGCPELDRDRWLMEHMPLLAEAFAAIEAARASAGASHDRELVPAALLGNTEEPAGDGDLADQPVALLDGRTPRDAAADPALRPRLITWMKHEVRVHDRQRRTQGLDVDLNPLLQQLGLDELVLAPPPLGFIAEDEEEEPAIPLDDPPPQDLLDGEELNDRLEAATGDEALWNRLEIRLADILDAFNDLGDKLNANELEVLQSTVLAALGALHPEQPPGYEPDPERMLARYEAWITSGNDDEELADYVDRIFAETRQPALCEAAADLLFFLEKQGGKKLRPKKLDVLMTALAAAVWEAAHWPPRLSR